MQYPSLIFRLVIFFALVTVNIQAQTQQLFTSQQFRLGDRVIRIAEPGELTDSVNVWGDVGSSGRYLIPKGTNITKLLSYSFGPQTLRDGETNLDWSKMRVEINIQEFDPEKGLNTIEKFKYRFEEPFPDGMYDFIVKNNQTITVRVKRKPSFRDYIAVVGPILTSVLATFAIIDRVKQ